jgi:hypothetical protein
LFELLLIAALAWPAECLAIGELYYTAAQLRDRGHPLKQVLTMAGDQRVKRSLRHVYAKPDMTPDEWRWFAIGVCVGDENKTVRGTV